MIIRDKNYRPAPFSNGADFKSDDIDVSAVSPLLLSAAVVRFLLTCTDQQQKGEILQQLDISVDGFASDKLCFYVEDTSGMMPLTEYLKKGYIKPDKLFLLSRYFTYITLNTAEAFEFNPKECYERVIPHYEGLPHAWTHHEYLKKEYMNLPEWEQKDLCHTLIDYFSSHIQEPDIEKKREAYEWLKSVRKYKRLIILGKSAPTTPHSIMLYDQYTLPVKYQPNPKSKEMEQKLNTQLEGMIRLIESAMLLVSDPTPYLKENLEALLKVYNRSKIACNQIYEDIFKKLSYDEPQFRQYLFFEECKRLTDSLISIAPVKKGSLHYHFSAIHNKISKEIENISEEALKRGW